jgi:hypothetical protein
VIGADDLAAGVFYDTSEFATQVTRQRPAADDVTFAGIAGEEDHQTLDGRVVAPDRTLAFVAGPDVINGDMLIITTPSGNTLYRVREVRLVNDGQEARAWLKRVLA